MKTVEISLGVIGQPSRSGRIYPKEVMERALRERLADDKPPLWVTDRNGPKMKLGDVIGEVKEARVEDDRIVGEVQLMETTRGKHIIDMLKDGQARVIGNPTGYGAVKRNREAGVEEVQPGYELEYFVVEAVEGKKPN